MYAASKYLLNYPHSSFASIYKINKKSTPTSKNVIKSNVWTTSTNKFTIYKKINNTSYTPSKDTRSLNSRNSTHTQLSACREKILKKYKIRYVEKSKASPIAYKTVSRQKSIKHTPYNKISPYKTKYVNNVSYDVSRYILKRSKCVLLQKSFTSNDKSVTFDKKSANCKKHCIFFNRFGRCTRSPHCPYIHDVKKITVCVRYLRGSCSVVNCPFSHKISSKTKLPVCKYFLRGGLCDKTADVCPYPHIYYGPSTNNVTSNNINKNPYIKRNTKIQAKYKPPNLLSYVTKRRSFTPLNYSSCSALSKKYTKTNTSLSKGHLNKSRHTYKRPVDSYKKIFSGNNKKTKTENKYDPNFKFPNVPPIIRLTKGNAEKSLKKSAKTNLTNNKKQKSLKDEISDSEMEKLLQNFFKPK